MSVRRTPFLGAFTLIELLVVVSIIAILAAMLLPTIRTVRAMVKQTACINNQRQVMLAIIAYSNENEGFSTPGDGAGIDVAKGVALTLMYWSYLPPEVITGGPWAHPNGITQWNSAMWRWPNSFSCPSVDPGVTNPSTWHYSQRFVTDFLRNAPERWNAVDGAILMPTMSPTVPFLAETCSMTNPISTGSYWPNWPGWTGPRLTHQNKCVVSYKDGHTAARTKDQLVNEDSLGTFNFFVSP